MTQAILLGFGYVIGIGLGLFGLILIGLALASFLNGIERGD